MSTIKYFFAFAILLLSNNSFAQITFNEPEAFKTQLENHKKTNASRNTQVYRVQLYVGTVRAGASEVKVRMQQLHPDIPLNLGYESPFYKVKAGNFKTRFEAYKYQQMLIDNFPAAVIITDVVDSKKSNDSKSNSQW
jgi:hypothetical protein